jgi:hypothetical protein
VPLVRVLHRVARQEGQRERAALGVAVVALHLLRRVLTRVVCEGERQRESE